MNHDVHGGHTTCGELSVDGRKLGLGDQLSMATSREFRYSSIALASSSG